MFWMMLSGTHTRDAHEMIVAMYEEYYPQASANDAKFQLSPDKPDPLDLFDQCRAVVVPKGAVIFWSPWLLHGVAKLKTTAPAQSYIYLGFLPAVDRPEYKNIAKISEREDRIRSFEQGPLMRPNCIQVWIPSAIIQSGSRTTTTASRSMRTKPQTHGLGRPNAPSRLVVALMASPLRSRTLCLFLIPTMCPLTGSRPTGSACLASACGVTHEPQRRS